MLHLVFSHGRDSEPWGSKILAMAEVGRARGLAVDSIDYRDTNDPQLRTQRLIDAGRRLGGELILVGSSLGGHVAAAASTHLPTRGLFLLAPAFFMPGYEQYTPTPARCPIEIVHGWNDDIVPVDGSIRFARLHRCVLHVVDSDHRLLAEIPQICRLLDLFLERVAAPTPV
jgi:pimeloyl-ACP methyl ester carboxylesterase